MSIYLLEATRRISHRTPLLPMTKQQLFNMLIDYGAFKGSMPLKYAVKNIIFEGFWSKAANLYNIRGSYEDIGKLKSNVITTFGYPEDTVNIIFNAIWNVDDWDDTLSVSDETLHLHFEGLPIRGRSFPFIEGLIHQGYHWNNEKKCLVGCFYGINNCEIRCNTSNSEVPLYSVEVLFPDNTDNNIIDELLNKLRSIENNRFNRAMDIEWIIRAIHIPLRSFNDETRDIKPKIIFDDPTGHEIMIESFIPEPHNNLETID